MSSLRLSFVSQKSTASRKAKLYPGRPAAVAPGRPVSISPALDGRRIWPASSLCVEPP